MNTRILRICRRADGRFEVRTEFPNDSVLGVDGNINQAIESALREATIIARELQCRVVIQVQEANGRFKVERAVERPITKTRKSGLKGNL